MRKHAVLILKIFNGLLLMLGWVLTLYAYPRLPQSIPLFPQFSSSPPPLIQKFPSFFLYPFIQNICFALIAFFALRRKRSESDREKYKIFQEYIYLTLIFVNLIFIHLIRGIIYTALQTGTGVEWGYFIGLCLIILILIPYYRIRLKLLPFDKKRSASR